MSSPSPQINSLNTAVTVAQTALSSASSASSASTSVDFSQLDDIATGPSMKPVQPSLNIYPSRIFSGKNEVSIIVGFVYIRG